MRYKVVFTDDTTNITNIDITFDGKAVKSVELIEDASKVIELKNGIMDIYGGICVDDAVKIINEGMKKILDRQVRKEKSSVLHKI